MENLLLKTTEAWQIGVIFEEQKDSALRMLPRLSGTATTMAKCRALAARGSAAGGCAGARRVPGGEGERCHTPNEEPPVALMDTYRTPPV